MKFWMRFLPLSAVLVATLAYAQDVERGAPLLRKPALAAQIGPVNPDGSGVKIMRVFPDGTASAVGLKEGDVLIAVNGEKISSRAAVGPTFLKHPVGTALEVEVEREGKKLVLKGKQQEKPRMKANGFKVHYDQVKVGDRRIRVIATYPESAGPHRTIFMIGGIGAYSLDGDYESTAYGNILGQLAKDYAIVRMDKPGQGDSEGPAYTDLGFEEELAAYKGALKLTKTLPFVDKDRIAIFGHSMGGTFGPLVAKEVPVKALAVSGTLAKTLTEYMLENTRRQALLAGAPPAEVEKSMTGLSAVCHYLFNEQLSPEAAVKAKPELKEAMAELTPDGKTFSGVGVAFFQQLAKMDVVGAFSSIDSKVLALWGENEFISTRWDHEYIADIVNRKNPGNGKFMVVSQSDHGFNQTTSTKDSFAKWGKPGATFNPNIIEILSTWFAEVLK